MIKKDSGLGGEIEVRNHENASMFLGFDGRGKRTCTVASTKASLAVASQQPQQFAACLSATSSPNHSVVGAAAISAATSKKRCRATEDPDKVYEVERIMDVRWNQGRRREYLIMWKGYAEKYNTWEPEESFVSTLPLEPWRDDDGDCGGGGENGDVRTDSVSGNGNSNGNGNGKKKNTGSDDYGKYFDGGDSGRHNDQLLVKGHQKKRGRGRPPKKKESSRHQKQPPGDKAQFVLPDAIKGGPSLWSTSSFSSSSPTPSSSLSLSAAAVTTQAQPTHWAKAAPIQQPKRETSRPLRRRALDEGPYAAEALQPAPLTPSSHG